MGQALSRLPDQATGMAIGPLGAAHEGNRARAGGVCHLSCQLAGWSEAVSQGPAAYLRSAPSPTTKDRGAGPRFQASSLCPASAGQFWASLLVLWRGRHAAGSVLNRRRRRSHGMTPGPRGAGGRAGGCARLLTKAPAGGRTSALCAWTCSPWSSGGRASGTRRT